ncbi:hypothetical protein K493DRAFT_321276 [Basidiobolus meristosporus CBS 931.73]|uniref:Yeast cell wall synthesis Kre9/Knh1-like N-terminal domain-containing protein n=1 Tax=Basidiobolus meristosporus CBS 931.73 TaxID=1314790 RepID=A0A1Y1WX56_9FUNG|nr:hypothetical protein K493DRAFT_363088 [Basidiobolus meristosporus CBS 931.73]ORX78139.1 hypothetical protein K493DRAFT_321276 [Basidiobolus meristosporus CBS 931.73]|eukprot:ORX78138.1 hypothetical protein K493DRAFT_363088 [Basidiobolus meristosporus CBS 931.73]
MYIANTALLALAAALTTQAAPVPSSCKGWRLTSPPNIPGLTWNTGTNQGISWDTGASKVKTVTTIALVSNDNTYNEVFVTPNKPADTWGSVDFTLPLDVPTGNYHFQVGASTSDNQKCLLDSNSFKLKNIFD